MLNLKNNAISVQVIDPDKDTSLIGPRYCVGGYIFQAEDTSKGGVFSGPRFPEGPYNVFDGQGAPEVFETALNQDSASINDDVLVIGVGLVKRTNAQSPFHVRDNPVVKEFTSWNVELSETSISMKTSQHFMGWGLELSRVISLQKRVIKSQTSIKNIVAPNAAHSVVCAPVFSVSQEFSGMQIFNTGDLGTKPWIFA